MHMPRRVTVPLATTAAATSKLVSNRCLCMYSQYSTANAAACKQPKFGSCRTPAVACLPAQLWRWSHNRHACYNKTVL